MHFDSSESPLDRPTLMPSTQEFYRGLQGLEISIQAESILVSKYSH
jgi:hypothetical protein